MNRFSVIREISAVTFPAYDATEINARSKDALESARAALEIPPAEGEGKWTLAEIELLKAKALNSKSKIRNKTMRKEDS